MQGICRTETTNLNIFHYFSITQQSEMPENVHYTELSDPGIANYLLR